LGVFFKHGFGCWAAQSLHDCFSGAIHDHRITRIMPCATNATNPWRSWMAPFSFSISWSIGEMEIAVQHCH
jgi:hypothetical protein